MNKSKFLFLEDAMIVSTTDPISLVNIENPETHPFVVEGVGEAALKIYFENEMNLSRILFSNRIPSSK